MTPTELIHAYYDAFNRGNREGMLALLTDDVVHDLNQGVREVGREAFATFMARMDHCYTEQLRAITVMVNGQVLESGPPAQIRASAAVRDAYLGADALGEPG